MTSSVDEVLLTTDAVFLDFDGPVTDLFIEGRNQAIADRMRSVLAELDIAVETNTATTKDPLAVLRWVAQHCTTGELRLVERTCIDGETDATSVSRPTVGSHDFIRACYDNNRPLVIVSNNVRAAIENYLDRYQLNVYVTGIVGRIVGRPDLMKPHPALVEQALTLVGASPGRVAFIGDSLTDAQVADLTGLRFIGYAKNPRRGLELAAAGHSVQVNNMSLLAQLLGST